MENVLGAEDEEQLEVDLNQLTAWRGDSVGLSCSYDDPYADASILYGTQPALPMDQKETRRLVMKRKVLRHRPDGTAQVFDESVNAKPQSLGHSRTCMDDTISEGEIETNSGTFENCLPCDDDDDDDDDDCLPEDASCSVLGDFGGDSLCSLLGDLEWDSPHSPIRDFGSNAISEYPIPRRRRKTYIAPQADRVKRTDPAARLKAYRREWERFSFPGQDPHEELRRAVHKQMVESRPPPRERERKRLVPNKYVVPTTKSRDSLRFAVRWDLAHHLMPRRYTSS